MQLLMRRLLKLMNGHSSTSISAALGVAFANKLNNRSETSIAVIGDGALTGGMSFEALNHAGDTDANLLIILNDNDMSISKNVGAPTFLEIDISLSLRMIKRLASVSPA